MQKYTKHTYLQLQKQLNRKQIWDSFGCYVDEMFHFGKQTHKKLFYMTNNGLKMQILLPCSSGSYSC